MTQLLIQNCWLDGRQTDILIEGNRIARIATGIEAPGADRMDAGGMAAMPPFYNTHNHLAMSLLRGYADDMELFTWLNDHIWPLEATLTPGDVYIGTRLALLEMIRGGTVFFNDMYWFQEAAWRAAVEMGVRGCIGLLYICGPDGRVREQTRAGNDMVRELAGTGDGRIRLAHAPHAVYTVPPAMLETIAAEAAADGLPIHIHCSETERENLDCRKQYGVSPAALLDRCGLLGERTVLAHAVHLDRDDMVLLKERRAVISHCPCSNLKLTSGLFRYQPVVEEHGIRFTIGTDGCASSNNLSMLEAMKFAALLAKQESGDPAVAPCRDIFRAATRNGAGAFGIDAGIIAEGKLADLMLVNRHDPMMVADFDVISNLVYSADTSVIDTVICNGRVLMRNRQVDGEEEIIREARAWCASRRRK